MARESQVLLVFLASLGSPVLLGSPCPQTFPGDRAIWAPQGRMGNQVSQAELAPPDPLALGLLKETEGTQATPACQDYPGQRETPGPAGLRESQGPPVSKVAVETLALWECQAQMDSQETPGTQDPKVKQEVQVTKESQAHQVRRIVRRMLSLLLGTPACPESMGSPENQDSRDGRERWGGQVRKAFLVSLGRLGGMGSLARMVFWEILVPMAFPGPLVCKVPLGSRVEPACLVTLSAASVSATPW